MPKVRLLQVGSPTLDSGFFVLRGPFSILQTIPGGQSAIWPGFPPKVPGLQVWLEAGAKARRTKVESFIETSPRKNNYPGW